MRLTMRTGKEHHVTILLHIANLGKGLQYLGQVYSNPRDAPNEFVSNAAGEYAQAGPPGRTVRVTLRRARSSRWGPGSPWSARPGARASVFPP
jgi:hypothetical protein